jgi:hypothetical protein
MADFKQCEFFLLRYIPNSVRGEFVNIGVVLLEQGDEGFTGVRFTRDWRRARCLDPEVDIELLQSLEDDLERVLESRFPEIINYREAMSRRAWLLGQMHETLSGALEVTPMAAVFAESPRLELGKLARMYLEATPRTQRAITGRRAIYNAMREEFEKAGVWQSAALRKGIAVAQYARKGDPLKIDCGYRPNGVIHLFHAVSLATDVNSATLLACGYSEMQEGLQLAEHAMSHLTAITEHELDLGDEGIAFALATLERSNIEVKRISEMPQIAEGARIELNL